MKRLRLYLDTTVWNFAFAEDVPDYKEDTLEFFAKVRMGLFEIFTSDVVLNESLAKFSVITKHTLDDIKIT